MNENQDQDLLVEPIESHSTLHKYLTINTIWEHVEYFP